MTFSKYLDSFQAITYLYHEPITVLFNGSDGKLDFFKLHNFKFKYLPHRVKNNLSPL